MIRHPWVVGVSNIALIMVVYTLMRLFFFLISRDLYPDVSGAHLWEMMVGGLRFDVTALFYLNSLYMVLMFLPLRCRRNKHYLNIAKWCYWVPNTLGIIANCADMVYVRFTDKRTSLDVFKEFANESNLMSVFWESMVGYWYVTLFALVLIVLWILLTRTKAEIDYPQWGRWPKVRFYVRETALFLVSIYFVVIGIRSGFGAYTRPLTLSNALQYTDTPLEANIVLNTPFSILLSSSNKALTDPHYMSLEEAEKTMNPLRQPREGATPNGKNVVVFIMESFSKEYIGFFNRDLDKGTYKGYTPFLDSLLEHSVTYRRSFATGRKSIDAMPSILSSLPRVGEPYILTPYYNNSVMSIPSCLRELGYQTAFFHGAPNGSMGFQAYARSCGFEAYYGMNEYEGPEAFDGTWAIWDEEFLQYYARQMSKMHEPFMTAVFTASSHHPYKVPERYAGVFDKGTQPIHACIGYSDNALRLFFETAKQQPWYHNTLFVLTADHTNQLEHAEYVNDKGRYEVPILFYDPQREEGLMVEDMPVSQVDIMPSVLAYTGYDRPYFSFGEDVLTGKKETPYVVCSNQSLYQVVTPEWFMLSDGEKVQHLYEYTTDPCLKEDQVAEAENEEVQEAQAYLRAFLQQYITRMIENKLKIEN
ncbi:MAG: sulfatase-like hydrolase/transferase [Paludibacteraceae bacterium]|nr:sulfatase-like hydrolase/transferase [Paludibacteraceae bacterium]